MTEAAASVASMVATPLHDIVIIGTYYAAAIIMQSMEVLKLWGASSSVTKGLVYSYV